MGEIAFEAGQVATASGFIYICHPKYGISEVRHIILEPYMAIVKMAPINSDRIPVDNFRRLDFGEFERIGFGIDFQLEPSGPLKETNSTKADSWLADDFTVVSVEDEHDLPATSSISETKSSRKRGRPRSKKKEAINSEIAISTTKVEEQEPELPVVETKRGRKSLRTRLYSPPPTTDRKSKLSTRVRPVNKLVKYVCNVCQVEYASMRTLRRHRAVMGHGEKEVFKLNDTYDSTNVIMENDNEQGTYMKASFPGVQKCPLLQTAPIRHCNTVASIMAFDVNKMIKTKRGLAKICDAVPQNCSGESSTYLVDVSRLEHVRQIIKDGYGSWGHASSENKFYSIDYAAGTVKRLNRGRWKKMTEGAKIDLKIRRRFYKHPQAKEFKKSIYLGYFGQNTYPRWAVISYEWSLKSMMKERANFLKLFTQPQLGEETEKFEETEVIIEDISAVANLEQQLEEIEVN